MSLTPGGSPQGPIARLRPSGGPRIRLSRPKRPPQARSGGDSIRALVEWHHLTPAGRQDEWVGLVRWVVWLHDRYELGTEARLPGCWPAHPGLVEELRALKAWREEIYGPLNPGADTNQGDVPGQASQGDAGPGQGSASAQAARYWHAELRQVLTAATTFYAPRCRSGHQDSSIVSGAMEARWLGGDPNTGIPIYLLASTAEAPEAGDGNAIILTNEFLDAALERGVARFLGELVTNYIEYRGAWWIPEPQTGPKHLEAEPDHGDGGARWLRITDKFLSAELDRAARRMRAADDMVALRRQDGRAFASTHQLDGAQRAGTDEAEVETR